MAITDTVLPVGGGPDGKSPIFVPAKTHVMWSVYSMHRRSDFYGEDAEEFRPERWEQLRPGWEYLPFNGGPRICIGRKCLYSSNFFASSQLFKAGLRDQVVKRGANVHTFRAIRTHGGQLHDYSAYARVPRSGKQG